MKRRLSDSPEAQHKIQNSSGVSKRTGEHYSPAQAHLHAGVHTYRHRKINLLSPEMDLHTLAANECRCFPALSQCNRREEMERETETQQTTQLKGLHYNEQSFYLLRQRLMLVTLFFKTVFCARLRFD